MGLNEGALDRRGLAVLASGHAVRRLGAGRGARAAAVPHRPARLSYGAAAALVLITSVGLVGHPAALRLVSDRLALPWLMPLGVLLAGIGSRWSGRRRAIRPPSPRWRSAASASRRSTPRARASPTTSRGERRGAGMSLFSLGGNAGFALGPALVTPLCSLRACPARCCSPCCGDRRRVLARELGRLRASRPRSRGRGAARPPGRRDPDDWPAFARLGGVVALRSCIYFGLQAFVPVWFTHQLGTGEGRRRGGADCDAGRGRDRHLLRRAAGRPVGAARAHGGLVRALVPVLAAFLLAPPRRRRPLVAVAGSSSSRSFSVSVVMGQEYLPTRLGLASG